MLLFDNGLHETNPTVM